MTAATAQCVSRSNAPHAPSYRGQYPEKSTDGPIRREALTRQLVDKAVAGDSRIINPLLAEIHKNEAKTERTQAATTLSPVDHEVIRVLYARLARNAKAMKKKE